MSLLSLHFGRRTPVVLQAEAAECGLACLAMVAGYHGFETDLAALRSRFSASARGINLAQLMQVASDVRLSPRALRLEPRALSRVQLPCIAHWNLDHFVVIERVAGDGVHIVDPGCGRRKLHADVFSRHFTGVVLELTPAEDFQPAQLRSELGLRPFFKGAQGLPALLGKLLALSLALQAFALVTPFFGQLVIDQVLPGFDADLLTLLVVGFGLLALINTAISGLRSFIVLVAGARLQFAWASKLFRHLVRLPLTFFERRHMGDVLSRFRSLSAIQNLVTTTIVEAFIDGLMTVTTLVVMFLYGPQLALVSVCALGLYGVIRLITYRHQQEVAHEALVLSAKENSHFLESLRGILAIKSFSREQTRESAWQNRVADALRASYKTSALSTYQQLASQILFGFENLIVVAVGATAVMSGGFSVGMLIAFLAYRTQFNARASALIDKAIEYRLASVHLDRLADIALAPKEAGIEDLAQVSSPIRGELEVRNLSYRYSPSDPHVVQRAELHVRAGECLAIVGPSGTGKTTLLKLLMGLLTPDEGEVCVDGRDVRGSFLGAYRRQIASVMQEDTLLSGSLLDNITFFDPQPDRARVEECAKVAALHEEISAMPMSYFTLVGDMGAALSGGQKQRLLLARALYARPRILFLDEATSHLDPVIEKRIHQSLAEMNITRIVVAHRRETWGMADRVVHFAELNRSPVMVRSDGPLARPDAA